MRATSIVLAALALSFWGWAAMARTTGAVDACPHSSAIITSQAGGIHIGDPRHDQAIVVAGLNPGNFRNSNDTMADEAGGGALTGGSASGVGN